MYLQQLWYQCYVVEQIAKQLYILIGMSSTEMEAKVSQR